MRGTKRTRRPNVRPRRAEQDVGPEVYDFLNELAAYLLQQPARHVVDILTSPSWELGRGIKATALEAAFRQRIELAVRNENGFNVLCRQLDCPSNST